MSAPLGSQQAHALRRAEARWLQSAQDRLRVRPGRAERRDPVTRSTSDDAQESQ